MGGTGPLVHCTHQEKKNRGWAVLGFGLCGDGVGSKRIGIGIGIGIGIAMAVGTGKVGMSTLVAGR